MKRFFLRAVAYVGLKPPRPVKGGITFKIRGKYWTVIEIPPPMKSNYGYCDFARNLICIDAGLSAAKKAEVVAHEIAHCVFPEASEKKVTTFGKIFTRVWSGLS